MLHGKARPRVGLLSNGSEEHKGTALTRETHRMLARVGQGGADAAAADFEYLGCVEGRDVFRGAVDVVVTDGFTGNVVLKSVEGAAEVIMSMVREEVARAGVLAKLGAALMLKPLRRLRAATDYAEYGGAPMLGVDGVALVCHGRSNGRAIENAIRVAVKSARAGLGTETTAAMARNAFLWAPPAAAAPQAAGAPS